MRAVIQSSLASQVSVNGKVIGQISKGMVILVGVCQEDGPEDVAYLVRKISQLRIFEDQEGKTNLALKDIDGEILSISQFTLYANTRKGNRPSFIRAADPALAQDLYELFNQQLVEKGHHVETGEFGAMMQVDISNNGPMTIILDSKDRDL